MPKVPISLFTCTKCDAQFLKWAGQCPECHAWGAVKELETPTPSASSHHPKPSKLPKPGSFAELSAQPEAKMEPIGVDFFDRTLSGGLVPGSVALVGGEPGIGKSTLLAQVCLEVAKRGKRVLYIAGEESPSQILRRLGRLDKTIPASLEWLDTTSADVIAATIEQLKPALTIVDSVQTIRLPDVAGEAGNMTQVKASAAVIAESAKRTQSSVVFVGQVTKDGDLAGPRVLEHLVDTVAMLEGDRYQAFRILRLVKHRFGTTDESAILEMTQEGLKEVLDPSAAFIADRPKQVSGTVVTCLTEGSRPVLVEIQALVSPAGFGTPTRRVSGVDPNRVSLLLAVLAKRAGLGFGDQDVFVNAIGGIDAKDPSIDLAIALALASAKLDKPLKVDVAAWGEVGLAGELRPVSRTELRSKEAKRLGFSNPITYQKALIATIKDALKAAGLAT